MTEITLRKLYPDDWNQVARLIYLGTNAWYESRRMGPIFQGGPESTRLFCEVYEALDPGCCIVAVHQRTKKVIGSCFYHPRSTHIALGIMNVHPDHFGKGVANQLVRCIVDIAEAQQLPIRLVSSALNLDSFSLYTRAGFFPYAAYQDMQLAVPESGLEIPTDGIEQVRAATKNDVPAMVSLEMEINHISREKDYRYFIENESGIWHVSVYENKEGRLEGFLVSVNHTASNMLGPGISRSDQQAAALLHTELNHHRGRAPVFLIPVARTELVQTMYGWGARNCEIHFAQVRGKYTPSSGVVMPTFMPETG